MSPFIQGLEQALGEAGISKTELARRIGRSQPQVTRIFSGETKNPPKETVAALEEALGLGPNKLWDLLHPRQLALLTERPEGWVLPLYGHVRAGQPTDPDNDEPEMFDILDRLGKDVYLLKVKGPSMSGDGIHDGDIVAVRRTKQAQPGQLVVASVDGDTCVKRLGFRRGLYELLSSHPDFPPRTVSRGERLGIAGVVVGLVRLY